VLRTLFAGCTTLALGAAGCASSDASTNPGSSNAHPVDPVAGISDSCGLTVSRGLYSLGLPGNGRDGDFLSIYDATPSSTGEVGFYPLALSVADSDLQFAHSSTQVAGASNDPRCAMVEQTFYFQDLVNLGDVQLDPVRYPGGQAQLHVDLDLRFDDVAFPKTLADVALPFDPKTRAEIIVEQRMVMPTRMTLDVTYLNPITASTSAVVEQQHFPLEFECKTAFPLKISWQPSSHDGPFCAANDVGQQYCLAYELHHGGGDCRFATEGNTLTTVEDGHSTVDFAGSLTPILDASKLTGMSLAIDTIHLR
jgi:hypothetical protein